ncbi:MAG: toll/interleukin-1 receptor domain-containing protein [Anaerolineae bacterium]
MGYVFISYLYRDFKFASLLTDELQKEGVRVWLDAREIKPGADWGSVITEALEASDAVIFIASADSTIERLEYLRADLRRAISLGKLIIPVAVDEVGFRSLPDELKEFQLVDARDPNNAIGTKDRKPAQLHAAAFKEILERLPDSVQSSKPVKPQAPKSKGYVFISYAQEDTEFVERIRQFLKERGYGYWDYQDSDRNYQTQLFLELEDVIKGAAATLSVLSPDWKKSQWAAKEYLFSQEVGVPVFLLMAREMGPTLVTAGYTYIDFSRDTDAGFAKLDKELRRKGLIE